MDEIEHKTEVYGNVRRMKVRRITKAVRRPTWKIEGRNRKGRPRATWNYNIQQSMRKFEVTDQDTEDRERWRSLIKGNV